MARPLRIDLAGGLCHVNSRGDRREAIDHGDADRHSWLTLFGQVCCQRRLKSDPLWRRIAGAKMTPWSYSVT